MEEQIKKILTYNTLEYTLDQVNMLSTIQDKIDEYIDNKVKNVQLRVSGYAGTGKTTVIKNILKYAIEHGRFSENIVLAPTNKAVLVLRDKMVDVKPEYFSTIHAYIYGSPDDKDSMTWSLKKSVSRVCVIVEESSMVNKPVYQDIIDCFQNSVIIFIGDGFQLEPVGEDIGLLKHPDITLTEVKRNAGDILNYSVKLRTEHRLSDFTEFPSIRKSRFIEVIDLYSNAVRNQDDCIYITATNRTRVLINEKVRNRLYSNTNLPQVGDRLISIANSNFYANGELFNIDTIEVHADKIITFRTKFKTTKERCIFCTINGKPVVLLPITEEASFQHYSFSKLDFEDLVDLIGNDNIEFDETGRFASMPRKIIIATYGYATSCHKAQGSQWKSVYVDQDYMPSRGWDNVRWRYTAITRAESELTMVVR